MRAEQKMFYQCQSRKGHVLLRDRVHLDPFKYNIPVSLSVLSLPWKICWIPKNPHVKCNSPHHHSLTWRWWHLPQRFPLLLFRFWEFLFLVYCVASRQSLHVFPWKPFCLLSIFLHYLPVPSAFQYVFFFSPFLFHFLPPSHFILFHPPSLYFSFTAVRNLYPPLFMINQGCERRCSVGGISREADEISGAHLVALYGDLLGWDKQQASHHSQPNRLPACMCLFLLHCHDHCHCQGWSSPRRPALW